MRKMQTDISFLTELEELLNQRKSADPTQSYVAGMHSAGLDAMLLKLNEETGEMMLASRDFASGGEHRPQLLHEAADVLFHWLLALSHQNVQLQEVIATLKARQGQRGLVEKAAG